MKRILSQLFALLVSLGAMLCSHAAAQTGQIELTPGISMNPNPSPYLSDWQSQPQTIVVSITLNEAYTQPVKLMAQISLNGTPAARTNSAKMRVITLHQGMNRFDARELVPFDAIDFLGGIDQGAKRSGKLPEGHYELCVSFVNAETGQSIPGTACTSFGILAVQPPTLISPAGAAVFSQSMAAASLNAGTNTRGGSNTTPLSIEQLATMNPSLVASLKQFDLRTGGRQFECSRVEPANPSTNFVSRLMEHEGIFYRFEMKEVMVSTVSGNNDDMTTSPIRYSWLPPMPMPSAPVTYRLRIVPVYPTQSDAQMLIGGTPAIERTITNTTTIIDPTLAPAITTMFEAHPQVHFVWGVQALDIAGNPIGQNGGWSEPRRFDIAGDPDFDLLRVSDSTKKSTPQFKAGFFDVFQVVDEANAFEPCPYTYRTLQRKFYTPCKNGMRSKYEVWGVFHCSLLKGHTGPHHGTMENVYVLIGSIGCTSDDDNTGTTPTESLPTGAKIVKRSDLEKIPTREEADKADAAAAAPAAKPPCPAVEKTLLRTVAGSWRRGKTDVSSISLKNGATAAWAYVTWERDIWNVYLVKHCTLRAGHGLPHVFDKGSEEFEKAMTHTETDTYDVGVPQAPPKPGFGDGLPQEDPPKK